MDKENPFCGGKYRTETEKETYIWKRIYFWVEEKKNRERGGGKYFCIGQDKRSRKKRKMFLHGKRKKNAEEKGGTYFLLWRRRKRRELFGEGKYFFAEEKKYGEGNGGKYHGEGKIVALGRKMKALYRGVCGHKNMV